MAYAIAIENSNIKADVVEVSEFPPLGERYSVRSVPQTVVNEVIRFTGAIEEGDFVDKVVQAGVRENEGSKS